MKIFSSRRGGQAVPGQETAEPVGSRPLNLTRNITAMLIDGIGWPLGQSFVSPQTILPLFIALLSRSSTIIGLVVAVQALGQIVPQLFIANRLEHMPIKRIYVVVIGIVMERLPYVVLAVAVVVMRSHLSLLLLFFACWVVANVGTGLNMPAFNGLYAKAIPIRLRGRLGGIGNSAGALLAVVGAYVTTLLLERTSGIPAFSPIFVIGFVILLASVIPLGFVDEPPSEVGNVRKPTLTYLREIFPLLRANRSFARYVLFQVSLQLAYSAPPFITAYAVLHLGVTTSTIGIFTAVLMGANALGSLLFGPLADHIGYRRVFTAATCIAIAGYAILVVLPPLRIVYICVALVGLLLSTQFMSNNMAMEFCTPGQAGTFTAIAFTASAPVRVLGPIVLGVIADRLGMRPVFLVVVALSLFALYLILFRVSDPRHSHAA